jgi:hypothetical protein
MIVPSLNEKSQSCADNSGRIISEFISRFGGICKNILTLKISYTS